MTRRLGVAAVAVLVLGGTILTGGCGSAPTQTGSPATAGVAATPQIGAPALNGSPGPLEAAPAGTPRATRALPRLNGRTVAIDPGHNGGNADHPEYINRLVDAHTHLKPCNTTGAQTADGYPEHAFNWDVAQRLAGILRAAGANVVLTRTNDTGVGPCITDRAAFANGSGADVVISIHADGAPAGAHGFHVMEPASINGAPSAAIVGPSRRLAIAVRNRLRDVLPPANYIGKDGINTRSDMAGLNLSLVPVVMVECGNMKNAKDAASMRTPAFRDRLAAALAGAVADFLSG